MELELVFTQLSVPVQIWRYKVLRQIENDSQLSMAESVGVNNRCFVCSKPKYSHI